MAHKAIPFVAFEVFPSAHLVRFARWVIIVENNRIRGEITHSKAHRSHKYVNNAWSEISNSPPTLFFIPFLVPPH